MTIFIPRNVQFNPFTDWVVGGQGGLLSRDPLPVFPAGDPCEQFLQGQGSSLFDVVHPAFPLPTTASPTLQDALMGGFGEAVVPEQCKFPSLNSCQKRFLWIHKGVDLSPHPVVNLELQVVDTEKKRRVPVNERKLHNSRSPSREKSSIALASGLRCASTPSSIISPYKKGTLVSPG